MLKQLWFWKARILFFKFEPKTSKVWLKMCKSSTGSQLIFIHVISELCVQNEAKSFLKLHWDEFRSHAIKSQHFLVYLVAHQFGHFEFWIFVIVLLRQAQLKKSKQIFKIWPVQIMSYQGHCIGLKTRNLEIHIVKYFKIFWNLKIK